MTHLETFIELQKIRVLIANALAETGRSKRRQSEIITLIARRETLKRQLRKLNGR